MAAGRIFSQDNDQLINVGRSTSNPSKLGLESPSGDPTQTYYLPNLDGAISGPDLISVAVGDLDKIADNKGVNHDEVVIAYAQDAPNVGPGRVKQPASLKVNLAVINYTSLQPINVSRPLFVTQVLSPYPIDQTWNGGGNISELFSVAIGDFDGDGQNEIALATLGPVGSGMVNLSIFRYVHKLLTDTPGLVLASSQTFTFHQFGGDPNNWVPTISLMAGDFAGTHKRAELVLALQYPDEALNGPFLQDVVQAIDVDPTLTATRKAQWSQSSDNTVHIGEPSRIKGLAGLFLYDPSNGFDLYRREVAIVSNDPSSDLNISFLYLSSDLNSFYSSARFGLTSPSMRFTATAGALSSDPSIDSPVWKVAIHVAPGYPNRFIYEVSPPTTFDSDTPIPPPVQWVWPCENCEYLSDADNSLRPPLQAYDYRGRTVLLGAPFRITFNDLISTSFVLEEPPKHSYWDETQGKLQIVSRIPGIAVSMTNKAMQTFSAKSTDTSAHSEGGSDAVSAGVSAGGGFLGLAEVKASVDTTLKSSYNYETNKSSYDSNYSSRTLTQTASTDNDDFISGRMQTLDIWRYRVLGVPGTVDNKPVSTFYDLLLPGPAVDFSGGGLDFDWYQPLHENGNILSYPSLMGDPSSPQSFSPPDLGTYAIEIPCPQPVQAGDPPCKMTQSGAMIPSQLKFISGTGETISLDYMNSTGSGDNISYQHKTGTSTDVKVGFSAKGSIFGASVGATAGYEHNFNSNDSWGNAQTSDTTASSDIVITIANSAINSSQAYEFFPTLYTTLDGTIKVAHATEPVGSNAGKLFWAGLYGGKPDPALNLPLRFVRQTTPQTWLPNQEISRKQMRGFFVMSPNVNPVSGQYDILALAPVDGDKVRLSAQVYNYSTAKRFNNCLVEFFKVKIDSDTDKEIGPRQSIGQTTISLDPRATAPAQIIWDTKGSGSPNGQAYRIYVRLNSNNAINELYPQEIPTKRYAPELPIGLDPGQNDEGFGEATVIAAPPPRAANPPHPATVSFGSTPLAMVWAGNLLTQNVAAGTPVELTSQICTSSDSREPVNLIVFDGNPSQRHVIAWKRLYVPNHNKCRRTRFSWTPSRGLHQLTATIGGNIAPPTPTLPSDSPLTGAAPLTHASLEVNAQ
jgi:hypothetical protein